MNSARILTASAGGTLGVIADLDRCLHGTANSTAAARTKMGNAGLPMADFLDPVVVTRPRTASRHAQQAKGVVEFLVEQQ